MQFVGIGGQAPGADFGAFVQATGTGGFTQLQDNDAGDLYRRFGTTGRSTFLFVQEDGSFRATSFGVIGAEELTRQVNRLIES